MRPRAHVAAVERAPALRERRIGRLLLWIGAVPARQSINAGLTVGHPAPGLEYDGVDAWQAQHQVRHPDIMLIEWPMPGWTNR